MNMIPYMTGLVSIPRLPVVEMKHLRREKERGGGAQRYISKYNPAEIWG